MDPKGVPWLLNAKNEIYRRENEKWEKVSGSAQNIGIGADGSVWVIGTKQAVGGSAIFRWNGKSWDVVEGGGVGISVDDRGKPWVVNFGNEIFRRK